MTIPGPPASVLAAILRASPDFPYNPADPSQRRMAWFSPYNSPALPSLITDGVSLPQNAYLDANITISGYAASQGWGTQGVTVVSAAYTPSPADAVILCNANGGAFTITLPDATQPGFISPGQRYTVKKTDTSANTVTLAASAGQTIDGAPTQAITPAQSAISVVFSGTGWEVTDGGSAIGTNAISGVVVSGTPATGDVLTATGSGTADWQPSATGVLTTLGDTLYEGSTGPARLAGNTTTTKNFYIQTGTGSASAAPAWGGIATADLPAGSAGQTLTTTSAGAVAWQRAPVDWINAVTAYGADPTGAADSTTAIQDALNAATAGQAVFLPSGTYQTTANLAVPSGVALISGVRGAGSPFDSYGLGTLPVIGAILKPSAAFTGTAVLDLSNTSGNTVQQGGQVIRGITIDGSAATGTVHGIYAGGAVGAVTLENCMVYRTPGNGVYLNAASSSLYADDWYVIGLKVSACQGTAGVLVNTGPDSWWIGCESSENTNDGWQLATPGNSHFIGCKGENNGLVGFRIYQFGTIGTSFSNCTTQYNQQDGFKVSQATGSGVLTFTGCRSALDGRGGGTLVAGLTVFNSTVPVLAPGFACQSDATGPAYGAQLATSSYGLWITGGSLTGKTAATRDDGTNTTPLTAMWGVPLTVSTPAVPASGTAVKNTTGTDVVAYVSGGTMTSPIAVSGASTGMNSGPVIVPNGATITWTGTAAPTWVWQRL